MTKLIKDVIVSKISILYFDVLNGVIEQSVKNNRKNAINNATKVKYNKNESRSA
jgi:hypothetical protein